MGVDARFAGDDAGDVENVLDELRLNERVAFDGFEVASLVALGWFVWSAIRIAPS
jgi:hypothetical protein